MSAKDLTGQTCRAIASTIRSVLDRHKIRLADSLLAEQLDEAEWLGTFDGNVFTSAAWSEEYQDRTIEAVAKVIRLKRVAWALTTCADLPGFSTRARALRQLRVRIAAPQGARDDEQAAGHAWDILFELEIAAQLTNGPFEISLEEPDVVARVRGSDAAMGLACKRPRCVRAVSGAIGSAIRQVADSKLPGLAVLSLDLLLPTAPKNWIILDHNRECDRACDMVVGEAMSKISGGVGSALALAADRSPHGTRAFGGVVGFANVIVMAGLDCGRRYVNTKAIAQVIPIMTVGHSAEVVSLIRRTLELGQGEYRRDEWLEPASSTGPAA